MSLRVGLSLPTEVTQTAAKRVNMNTEKELACIQKAGSTAYENFHAPTVVYKKAGLPTHNGFKCKYCNCIVERQIGVSYMSGLSSHSAKCGPTTKQAQSLDAFGVTGGHPLTLTPEQRVRDLSAL
ncbi:hypothetical protein BDV93DRAFT_514450 [Ceratobasidium sp. AG-I]|nr:hypothetical protein BDV93DRAFT_514450 [Ceratobasidium sp. AG-I]